jgi:Domain of unknown function (DUF4383)
MTTAVCRVLGVVFILLGAWGLISGDQILMFHVNPLHDFVYLTTGVLALWAAYKGGQEPRRFSLIFGVVYGLLAVVGFMNVEPVVEWLNLNRPDNWLHLVFAAIFFAGVFIPGNVASLITHHDNRHPTASA